MIHTLHFGFERATKLLIQHTPQMKEIASEAIETLFAPRMIARQLTLAIALETGVVRLKYFQFFTSVDNYILRRVYVWCIP